MNIWVCCWMVASPSIGSTSWWLHSSPLWAILSVIVYAVLTRVFPALRTNSKKLTKKSQKLKVASQSSKIGAESEKWKIGKANTAAMLFVVVVIMGVMYTVARSPKYEVVTEHNIKILDRYGENEWAMSSDEEPSFVFRACPDFPNSDVIRVGYIADYAKWEEQGRCKSIRRADLGFWWRSGHKDYRRIQ